MPLNLLNAADAIKQLPAFDAVIDVRSEAEFAEDHLPGALNWPVLDNEERRIVGTLYVQVSPLEARKVGAALVARRIAQHLERDVHDKPREWKPLVYCWRGGQRSGTMAWFLSQIGFRVVQLQGGYKGFRTLVREQLGPLTEPLQFHVLCGRTGSGKTRLLHALATAGAQVLDLEGLAGHRGSVLGALPDRPQPSQKGFESALWDALRHLDASRPVYVESESAKIGKLRVPEPLLAKIRSLGHCVRVELPEAERVRLLLQEYGHFGASAASTEHFCSLIEPLVALRGRATVTAWQTLARGGQWAECFGLLMNQHYDPLYDRSTRQHFATLAQAPVVEVPHAEDFAAAAQQVLALPGAPG